MPAVLSGGSAGREDSFGHEVASVCELPPSAFELATRPPELLIQDDSPPHLAGMLEGSAKSITMGFCLALGMSMRVAGIDRVVA